MTLARRPKREDEDAAASSSSSDLRSPRVRPTREPACEDGDAGVTLAGAGGAGLARAASDFHDDGRGGARFAAALRRLRSA